MKYESSVGGSLGGNAAPQPMLAGVELGGTKCVCILGTGPQDVRAQVSIPTGQRDSTLDRINSVLDGWRDTHGPFEALGLASFGPIDLRPQSKTFGYITSTVKPGWEGTDVFGRLGGHRNLPAQINTDVNGAALAEGRWGAARGLDDFAYITVGTGIGGGIVIGGELIRGAHGISGELGHVMAVRDGHPCGCGAKGCLEQYASGKALTRFAQFEAATRPGDGEHLLSLVGGDPHKLTGPLVTKAAMAGDPIAVDAFSQIGYWLGRGLADLTQILDPQILVVGGGVIEAGELLLAPARAAFAEGLPSRARFPVADIVAASMGNTAGVVGAADLARRR